MLAASAPYLMRLYGEQYDAADSLLVLLALGWFFLTPSWILWNAAISRGQAWWSLLFNVIGTGCLLAFAMQFVGRGARGIALALLFSGMIQVGLQAIHYYAYKRRDDVGGLLRVS
jgi:O-antigen/teichoic acid export membrane protein